MYFDKSLSTLNLFKHHSKSKIDQKGNKEGSIILDNLKDGYKNFNVMDCLVMDSHLRMSNTQNYFQIDNDKKKKIILNPIDKAKRLSEDLQDSLRRSEDPPKIPNIITRLNQVTDNIITKLNNVNISNATNISSNITRNFTKHLKFNRSASMNSLASMTDLKPNEFKMLNNKFLPHNFNKAKVNKASISRSKILNLKAHSNKIIFHDNKIKNDQIKSESMKQFVIR